MVNLNDIISSSAPTANIPVGPPPAPINLPPPTSTPQVSVAPQDSRLIHRPTIITILLTFLGADFLFRIVNSIYILLTTIETFRNKHLLAHIFELSPLLCLFPALSATLTIIILLLIIKTRDFTRINRLIIIIITSLIPIVYAVYAHFLLPQPHTLITPLLNEITVISIIILVLTYFSKDYSPTTSSLTTTQIALLTLLISAIAFPTYTFTYSLVNSSLYPDLNQTILEKMVAHKLYLPLTLPLQLKVDSQFYISDTKDPNLSEQTVKILYSAAKKNVVINQTKVPSDFDLQNYVNLTQPSIQSEKITIGSAIKQIGYQKNSQIKTIYFVTPDFILITLITPSSDVTIQNLIQIAESLR